MEKPDTRDAAGPAGLPKIQHYVPRLLLKNFTCGKRDQVYVFDKLAERVFRTNIKNAACERAFYDVTLDDYILTLEPGLAELESDTAGVIQRVIDSESLELSEHDRALLSLFAAVQFLRGPSERDLILDANRQFEAKLGAMGQDIAAVKGWAPIDEEGAKQIALSLLSKPGDFAIHFADKCWVLLRPPKGEAFCISDNPVALQNSRPRHPFVGNLGLAAAGIEIYLPLTKTLTLAFLCPSIYSELKTGLEAVRDQHAPGLAAARAFLASIEDGTPDHLNEQELLRLNGLQVGSAARFVYASTEGFHVAREMIRKNPDFKSGPRLKVS